MTTRTGLRRLLALATALGIGALGLSAPAHADSANINPNARASLTIHKCVQPDQAGTPATGAEVPNACTPLNGVEFTIYKVDGVDLTTSAGWSAIQSLSAPETGTTVGSYTSTPISSQTTSGLGVASWSNLDLGLYLVRETNTGAPGTGVVLGSKPFLVTLPYNTADAWNYDVHVYPKNSVAGLTKTVDDSVGRAGYLGKGVQWTISADVPRSGENTQIDSYEITDNLPAGVTITNTDLRLSDGTALTIPSDVTCTGTVSCTFTSDGLAKLRTAGGQQVLLTLTTDISDVARASDGVFTNTATVTINGTTSAEASAQTTWGQLTVYKYDSANDGSLADAVFSLCLDAGCGTSVATGLTTGSDGTVLVPVLRPGTYYLIETAAPAGYALDATPRAVTVVAGVTNTAGATANYQPVANTKQNVPQLPITGGIGQVALAAGGIGLLIIGGAVMIAARVGTRRNRA